MWKIECNGEFLEDAVVEGDILDHHDIGLAQFTLKCHLDETGCENVHTIVDDGEPCQQEGCIIPYISGE